MIKKQILVLGAGAWGTAIAIALHRAKQSVCLLPRFEEERQHLTLHKENTDWLPGISIPEAIQIGPCYDNLEACSAIFKTASVIFWVIPVQFSVDVREQLFPILPTDCPIVIGSKGLVLDEKTKKGMLLSSTLTAQLKNPICILSGPNFAREVANDLYTSAVLASKDLNLALQVAPLIRSEKFRIYINQDMISVQIAGALKNVIAIACGIALGLELGQNTVSAIISMGIAECCKISTHLGGVSETLLGISGVGDLTLTCLSVQSRNTGFGLRIGKGESVCEILATNKQAVEGYFTTKSAYYMAQQLNLNLPLFNTMYDILYQEKAPLPLLKALLKSPSDLEIETFH